MHIILYIYIYIYIIKSALIFTNYLVQMLHSLHILILIIEENSK